MKKLKYLFYGSIGVIASLLILAIFLPKNVSIKFEKIIKAPKAIVYNLLANLEDRSQWDPIVIQPDVQLSEENGTHLFSWSQENVGSSQLEIVNVEIGNNVLLKESTGVDPIISTIQYSLLDTSSTMSTYVIIEYEGEVSWPQNLFLYFTKRSQKRKLLNELNHLEVIATERQIDRIYNGYKIVESIVKERNFIMIRDKIESSTRQQFYVQNLGILFKNTQEAGLEMHGMPSALFYTEDIFDKTLDMAVAIPVEENVNILGAESESLKTSRAITLDFYGDYSNTYKAHKAIKAYIADNTYLADKPIVEEYVTDPSLEKDPHKWLTKITYYIKGK